VPALTERTAQPKLKTKIKFVGGSVEAACALGVADGIVDLVESGETMRAAGLKAIDTVIESTAVLIQSTKVSNPQPCQLDCGPYTRCYHSPEIRSLSVQRTSIQAP